MPKCSIEREFEGMRAFDIIPHLEESNYSLESCEWAIRSFISFTGNAMQQNNTEAMAGKRNDFNNFNNYFQHIILSLYWVSEL